MSTIKGSSVWLYFANTDDPEKVRCKICKKELKNNRCFNLQQHLIKNHKIEVRLVKKHKDPTQKVLDKKLPVYISENENSSAFTYRANENETNPTDTLNNTDSTPLELNEESVPSIATIVHVKDEDIEFSDVPKILSVESVECNATETDVQGTINEAPTIPNGNEFEGFCRKTILESMPVFSDPLEVPTAIPGEVKFDEWAKRRREVIEIERLEMQNYKVKLELWNVEQKLKLSCSKFTKDIARRYKKN